MTGWWIPGPLSSLMWQEQIAAFYPQPFTVDQAMALIEERCGRFARGRHKGQLSGHLPIGCSTPGACQ